MSSWLPSFLSRDNNSPPTAQSRQPFNDSRDNHDRLFDTMESSPTSERDLQLLRDMPSLFTPDFPPCGLEIQIAYQNVLHRLRWLWLQHAADQSSYKTPHDIAKLVKIALDVEALSFPAGTLAHTKTRRPWRRENVFDFELRWAGYFVREADAMQRWPTMDRAQRDRLEFAHKTYRIPQELGYQVKKRMNRDVMFEMWEKWHEKKRKDVDWKRKESDEDRRGIVG